MAASSSGPPPTPWWDGPENDFGGNRVDGTFSGPTLPPFMDPEGFHGELHLMRMSGVHGPLPNRPFVIRRSVEKFIGGKIEGAFPEGRTSSYALKVRSQKQYSKLLTMSQLIDGTAICVTEHPTLNSVRCVVSCRNVIERSEDELLEELKEQGVKEVRRITRRNGQTRENTPALVLTCRGTIRPDAIDFGYIRCRTRPYYPSPMQCFNCWLFGHTKLRCQAKNATCGTCSGDHPIAENRECSHESFCKSCNAKDHKISSRDCPLWQFENAVQRIKIDQGLSYPSARRIVEQNRSGRSFASVTGPATTAIVQQTNVRSEEQATILAAKDAEIAELRAALAARSAPPAAANQEVEQLKALVAEQAKQIEALTVQISVFLKAVMPAANLSCPSEPTATSIPSATSTVVLPVSSKINTTTSMLSTTSDGSINTPSKNHHTNDRITGTETDLGQNVLSDSDSASSDRSVNAEFYSPNPMKTMVSPKTPKPTRTRTSLPSESEITSDQVTPSVKRPISAVSRTESLFQLQKKTKKKASEGLGTIPKKR